MSDLLALAEDLEVLFAFPRPDLRVHLLFRQSHLLLGLFLLLLEDQVLVHHQYVHNEVAR